MGVRTPIDFKHAVLKIMDGDDPTPNEIEVIFGDEGNITWTRSTPRIYQLDRGELDTVTNDDEVPLQVDITGRYTYIRGTSADVSVYDALHQEGTAEEWVSSDDREGHECDPYCVDLVMEYTPVCTPGSVTDTIETITFPFFRVDDFDADPDAQTITISGQCNVVKPEIARSAPSS